MLRKSKPPTEVSNKVTLATLDQKLENFIEFMRQHSQDDRSAFVKIFEALDGNGKPGLKTRLEVMEVKEVTRWRVFVALWSAVSAIGVGLIIKFIGG